MSGYSYAPELTKCEKCGTLYRDVRRAECPHTDPDYLGDGVGAVRIRCESEKGGVLCDLPAGHDGTHGTIWTMERWVSGDD